MAIPKSGSHQERIYQSGIFTTPLAMGTTLEQSGDGLVEKPSGSSLCRISLWQYVLTGVETGRLPENELTKELINYRDSLKANVTEQGEKLLGGKHNSWQADEQGS